MFTREILKSRNVVRIGQKPDVEYQIALRRQPVAKAEASYIDRDVRFITASAKAFPDEIAQLVYREFGRIDRQVRSER